MGDWQGFVPDEAQHEPEAEPVTRALRITPTVGEPFVMQFEWDDGNGVWFYTGVSE